MPEVRHAEPSAAAVQWLKKLVSFETISRSASNLEMLALADSALRQAGFRTRFTHSPDGQRANLFASHGEGDGGLLLSGHTDVVPVAGQQWTRPPFELTEDATRFYGRGT